MYGCFTSINRTKILYDEKTSNNKGVSVMSDIHHLHPGRMYLITGKKI